MELEQQERCQACAAKGEVVHENLKDHLFGVPGQWRYLRCPVCRSLWLDPRPTIADIHLAYETYYTHPPKSEATPSIVSRAIRVIKDAYRRCLLSVHHDAHRGRSRIGGLRRWRFAREEAERLFMYLPPATEGQRLLDVGCGNGDYLVRMTSLGWVAQGQEVDHAAIQAARDKGCNVLEGDLLNLQLPDESYDAVTLQHSVEHVHDPTALLTEVHRLLKPGGTAVVMTPNVDSLGHERFAGHWRGLEPPRHLFLPSPGALATLATNAGFASVQIETRGSRAWAFALASGRIANQAELSTNRRQSLWAALRFHREERRQMKVDSEAGEELVMTARRAD